MTRDEQLAFTVLEVAEARLELEVGHLAAARAAGEPQWMAYCRRQVSAAEASVLMHRTEVADGQALQQGSSGVRSRMV